MELKLIRKTFTDKSTIGDLLVDGAFECYTLEDRYRGEAPKVMHETAIPMGRYQVIVNRSPRFQRDLPRLLNVPGFEGILIHTGNTAADTSGCILPGRKNAADVIQESRPAFDQLFAKIRAALAAGEQVWISVEDGRLTDPTHAYFAKAPETLKGWDDAGAVA